MQLHLLKGERLLRIIQAGSLLRQQPPQFLDLGGKLWRGLPTGTGLHHLDDGVGDDARHDDEKETAKELHATPPSVGRSDGLTGGKVEGWKDGRPKRRKNPTTVSSAPTLGHPAPLGSPATGTLTTSGTLGTLGTLALPPSPLTPPSA